MAARPNPNVFKKLFRTPESRFLLGTAIKVWSISMMVEIIVGYIMYSNMRLNFYFFRSHGARGIDEIGEAYFQHVFSDIIDALPWILGYHIAIFFMGLYIGHLMLRPFRQMGDYCAKAIESPDTAYKIEEFSSYRLLTRFSEIFFESMRTSRQKNKLEPREIPPQYTGIHGPVFDAPFIFHFSFFMIIVVIVSIVTIMGFASDVYENMSQLAMRMLKADPKLIGFLHDQAFLVDEMWILTSILVIGLHVIMGIHLYSQVSGAAFGIFATMRSFMKGSWQSRVHLVGYSYLRDSTRSINKYLDWLQKNLTK
jgi:hypothetical protein